MNVKVRGRQTCLKVLKLGDSSLDGGVEITLSEFEHAFFIGFELPVRKQQFLSCFPSLEWAWTPLSAAAKTGNIEMCEFLLDEGADVNLVSKVSETVKLVCRWMWWGRDMMVVCVCVYVDSYLRFQFNLTGLLWRGMVVDCMCVCRQSS